MRERYPALEPFEQGMLDVGDGQRIYWEMSGNPRGRAALALHGGPGGGSSPGMRRSFDPRAYRLVQFDQRGCGKSTPSVADPTTELGTNTTEHLLGDIEKLRAHLGVDDWVVWGGSWGATLALAYAERHVERVRAMVLVSSALTRPGDVKWLYHGAGAFFPEAWERFRAGAGYAEDLVAAYDVLLNRQPDVAVRERAARDWCDWEDAVLSHEEGWAPFSKFADPAYRMTFARLCAHYFSHHAWIEDGALLRDAARLAGVPGVVIHGRVDISCPPMGAWELARAWPGCELHVVPAGHRGSAEMTERMLEALDRFGR